MGEPSDEMWSLSPSLTLLSTSSSTEVGAPGRSVPAAEVDVAHTGWLRASQPETDVGCVCMVLFV